MSEDYPYLATWCDSVEEADASNYGWIHWNGIAGVWPNFVRFEGKTYTFEQFKKEVWKL